MTKKTSKKHLTKSQASQMDWTEPNDKSYLRNLIYSYLRYGGALTSKQKKASLKAIRDHLTRNSSKPISEPPSVTNYSSPE